jgi:hypothetical protein
VLLGHYLALQHRAQCELAAAFSAVAEHHAEDAAVARACRRFEAQCDDHAGRIEPFVEAYRDEAGAEPDDLHSDLFRGPRDGGLGLLRDLHDLYLMTAECDVVWTLVAQAAQGARDRDLLETVNSCEADTAAQMRWAEGQMKQAAPQALVVAS